MLSPAAISLAFAVAPFGERGLKLPSDHPNCPSPSRRSLRGAWIEMDKSIPPRRNHKVAPFGERGLKYFIQRIFHQAYHRRSLRGAWIEI